MISQLSRNWDLSSSSVDIIIFDFVVVSMIAANNHYAGFGPGTVNIFRNMVDMSELSWENQQQIQEQLQQQKEQDNYPINNSNIFGKKTKKRQTSLTEFKG